MGAWGRVFPESGNRKAVFIIGHLGVQIPSLYSVDLINNRFGQGYSRTTWSIFFFGMVNFFHLHIIIRLAIHDFCEIMVKSEEYIDANTIIGGIKKASTIG